MPVPRVTRELVEELWEEKERIAGELKSKLPPGMAREALRDSHARRKPIPCGLTVHTGIGCDYGCLYCYIPDMGFPLKPRPYPLTGAQLALALASNPHLVPGPHGTLLAFGSVTEPFMPETFDRAIEYLEYTRLFLGNPQQVSTKTALSEEQARALKEAADPGIDVLVSIVTLRHSRLLEPGAPTAEERLETIRLLAGMGLHVTLFLRPIIPGVTDKEYKEIIERAYRAGARSLVPGSLRVTARIRERLAASRLVDPRELDRRLTRKPRGMRDQVPITTADIKQAIIAYARKLGMSVHPSSCSANIASHGLSCAACRLGPCGDPGSLPAVDEDAVHAIAEKAGARLAWIRVRGLVVEYSLARGGRRERDIIDSWIASLAKRTPVHVRHGRRP